MKALDKIYTDDLNEEQKKILSDIIKQEMLNKIEESVSTNSSIFAESIKKYLKSDEHKNSETPNQSKS